MSYTYHTVESASEKLDVHPRTVLRFINQGKLKALKVGRQWRIKNSDLRLFTGESVEERISRASAVIDIPVADKSEADRFQTLVLASLNSRQGNESGIDRRVDCLFNSDDLTVRFTLWGGISFLKDFFTLLDNYN